MWADLFFGRHGDTIDGMSDENEDAKYDHPWTEAEWLAEFRRNDVRTAKFGELLETFADDPDRREKIDREMGWNRDDGFERPWVDEFQADAAEIARELEERRRQRGEAYEEASEEEFVGEDDEFDEEDPETWDDEKFAAAAERAGDGRTTDDTSADSNVGESDDDEGDPWDDDDDDDDDPDPDYGPLSKIPPYALGMKLAVETVNLAKQFPEQTWANDDHYELFCDSVGGTFIPAAKITGGHSYGYDTNICGNIVCNRFALEAVEKSLAGFAELEAAGVLPDVFRDRVVPRLGELKQLIEERIATMRKRVWW
jgi:hypothetical protein